MATTAKPTLYSSLASQWANVPKLGLAEKNIPKDDIEIKETDICRELPPWLPLYKPQWHGSLPHRPLLQTPHRQPRRPRLPRRDLDEISTPSLTPSDPKAKTTMHAIIDLMHSDAANSNLILLQARDLEEYEDKRSGPFAAYIGKRQQVLEENKAAYPNHSFYGPKATENGRLHKIYTTGPSAERDAFFKDTHEQYVKFVAEMERLDSLLALPYAAGKSVTLADLHAAPWMAHVLAGVGTTEIRDLGKLEAHLRKSVSDFKIGAKVQKWWDNYTERPAFKEVFPVLH